MRIFTVDSFTKDPFCGNPAAVCLPGDKDGTLLPTPDEDTMQKIAAEMRLSETCFVVPLRDDSTGCNEYSIRWFTPTNEVNLCGHATLAAAHVLLHVIGSQQQQQKEVLFTTKDGLQLTVRPQVEANSKMLVMEFPCYKPVLITDPESLISLHRLVRLFTDRSNQVVSTYWSAETKKVFFVLDRNSCEGGLGAVEVSQRDMDGWMELVDLPLDVRGVCVTRYTSDSMDEWEMRYFSPWNGIGEDPVNGSSHTVLGPIWRMLARAGCGDAGVPELFHSEVCSPRGGEMWVRVADDESKVELMGNAVVVMSGHLHLDSE